MQRVGWVVSGGWGQVAREDPEITRQRDQLRDTMQQQKRTLEQIATAMARQFGDRLRPAWRHAYGWTQQHVADLYNCEVNDPNTSMTANRISDFERWPINGAGVKPTVVTFGVLAKIYSTRLSKLVDRHDRQKMSKAELIALAAVDSGIIPHQLPSAIPNFVGRAHELDILNAQLDRAAEGAGMVVITAIGGTAGIGKTTLALYWARTHIDHFPDGQLYTDLRGFSSGGTPVTPHEVIRGFLDAFRVPVDNIPATFDGQVALYRTLVEDRRLIIVLDNARDADQVRPLLPGNPSCMVLVTSRQQLASLIARERAMHITLDFLTTEEARQLLTKILGSERIQAEPDAVNELIQRCVGLPIALSIAAARILINPHLPLSALVSELYEQRQQLGALATGDSQLTDIRAVFSWSYTTLSLQAARLFRLLGVHPGPDIDTLAAASLAGLPEPDTRELLTELTRAHLLKEHTSGRYQFHDLLRAYASEDALTKESEAQRRIVLHRVFEYYLYTGVVAERHLDPTRTLTTLAHPQPGVVFHQVTDYEQALEWFTTEHAVLLAVIDHAATYGFDTHAWQLPWTLVTFLDRRGHWHDHVVTQQTALAAAERLGDRAAQALAYFLLSNAHSQLGRYTDTRACLRQALILYRDLADLTGQARTHHALGWVCAQEGQYVEAVGHVQQALNLNRVTGNHAGQARALNALGWDHALLGNHQQALTYCQQALNIFRDLDNRYGEASTLDSLGYAHHHLGHDDEAITHYQQALTLRRKLGYRFGEASTLTSLGDVLHAIGDHFVACQVWQQALAIFDQLGHPNADTVRTKLDTLDTDPDMGVSH